MYLSVNRYSMPVTRSRNGPYDVGGLDGNNTARFLFGDEDLGRLEAHGYHDFR